MGSVGKEFACNAGNTIPILGLGRFPEEGHGNLLQYFCLENPVDCEAWQASLSMESLSRTRLKQLSMYASVSLSSLRLLFVMRFLIADSNLLAIN